MLQALAGNDGHTSSCCLCPPDGAADLNGFSCDHTGNAVAFEHAVCIHNPAHHLAVGIHIRSRYVLVRPYNRQYPGGISPGKTNQLIPGQLGRVHLDSALGPAVGDIDYSTFK